MLCYRCGSHVPDTAERCGTCSQRQFGTARMPAATGIRRKLSPALLAGAPYRAGELIAERYRIDDAVGVGPLGFVFRARDTREDLDVAVKMIQPRFVQTREEHQSFAAVLAPARRFRQPSLTRLLDTGTDQGWPYTVHGFLDGLTLRRIIDSRLAKGQTFTLEEVEPILGQLTAALEAAHPDGAHGDLKPENVLVLPDLLKVTDWGVALGVPRLPFVQAQKQKGAHRYLAPELIGGGEVDPRADLYALGVLVGEMLTGLTPEDELPELRITNPGLPDAIEGFYRRALNERPAARFRSARELYDELVSIVEGKPPRVAEVQPPAVPTPEQVDPRLWELEDPDLPAGGRLWAGMTPVPGPAPEALAASPLPGRATTWGPAANEPSDSPRTSAVPRPTGPARPPSGVFPRLAGLEGGVLSGTPLRVAGPASGASQRVPGAESRTSSGVFAKPAGTEARAPSAVVPKPVDRGGRSPAGAVLKPTEEEVRAPTGVFSKPPAVEPGSTSGAVLKPIEGEARSPSGVFSKPSEGEINSPSDIPSRPGSADPAPSSAFAKRGDVEVRSPSGAFLTPSDVETRSPSGAFAKPVEGEAPAPSSLFSKSPEGEVSSPPDVPSQPASGASRSPSGAFAKPVEGEAPAPSSLFSKSPEGEVSSPPDVPSQPASDASRSPSGAFAKPVEGEARASSGSFSKSLEVEVSSPPDVPSQPASGASRSPSSPFAKPDGEVPRSPSSAFAKPIDGEARAPSGVFTRPPGVEFAKSAEGEIRSSPSGSAKAAAGAEARSPSGGFVKPLEGEARSASGALTKPSEGGLSSASRRSPSRPSSDVFRTPAEEEARPPSHAAAEARNASGDLPWRVGSEVGQAPGSGLHQPSPGHAPERHTEARFALAAAQTDGAVAARREAGQWSPGALLAQLVEEIHAEPLPRGAGADEPWEPPAIDATQPISSAELVERLEVEQRPGREQFELLAASGESTPPPRSAPRTAAATDATRPPGSAGEAASSRLALVRRLTGPRVWMALPWVAGLVIGMLCAAALLRVSRTSHAARTPPAASRTTATVAPPASATPVSPAARP